MSSPHTRVRSHPTRLVPTEAHACTVDVRVGHLACGPSRAHTALVRGSSAEALSSTVARVVAAATHACTSKSTPGIIVAACGDRSRR
jgi:hypothetical protein